MRYSRGIVLIVVILSLLIAGAASADDAQQNYYCGQPTRLYVGGTGRVTTWPNLPNRLRSSPSYYGTVVGSIPAGGAFSIIGGPNCASGLWWWQVSYGNRTGWTAEGDGYATYWLEPLTSPPPPPPACALTPRLSIGGLGRVLPSPALPNVVRTAPGTTSTGSNSRVIGQIPPSGVFSVLSGPNCGSDGRWWWQVNYNGLVGWTAEGEGRNNYWLEPWYNSPPPACPGFLPSRLTVGGRGAVTSVPNLPNRLRSGPGFANTTLGYIPVNGVFTILSGPYCADYTAWWQVNYNGAIGYTAEGQGSTYWLQPA